MGLTGRVIVSPDSMHGWNFIDDQLHVACADATKCQLVVGTGSIPSTSGGNAELATAASTDGYALQLQDYGGIRFDQINTLAYSTFRQSIDTNNSLTITLQLVVDYDVTDGSQQSQGRLIFDPTQGRGGIALQGEWERWNAKAGLWWGTETSVIRANKKTKNPCLQASPCTWSQLLTSFPNLGVHPTSGAILLKAGPGWTNFRGNVDSLTIDIGAGSTTFDFEAAAPAASMYRLKVIANSGVNFDAPLSRDTLLPQGTMVSFAFSAASGPGGTTGDLLTVVDDTLAANAGTISMDRDHTIYTGRL